ncbi:MAG: OstA-like protein [Rikenellaceae bacterium]
MRKIISLLIVAVLWWTLFDDVLFAQRAEQKVDEQRQTKVIDLTADIVYPITLSNNVEVMCLVGDFAAQHNGAIITADSAVRYNDKRLECFGNVLINKNTTYVYADRAVYNGESNEVVLHAPIVKMVDGEATLYCYNFTFNTLDNIGMYDGGGVMINGESVMESITGFYYSDTKELIGVGDVELSGDEYQMKSDSIIYNTETEAATYFENTNIWNQKDEYLYADAGDYDKAMDRYSFTLNGYILTDEQEIWSDSMDYFRASEHIFMRHNIQIDDTTQKSLIFGDYGEYIKSPGDMILVGRPSIINYDAEQGDSLFMRADTFEIFTLNRFDVDSLMPFSATEIAEALMGEDGQEMHEHEGHDHEGHDHDMHDHDHDDSALSTEHSRGDRPTTRPDMNRPQRGDSRSAEAMEQTGERGVARVPSQVGTPRTEDMQSRNLQPLEGDMLRDSVARDSLSRDSLMLDSMVLDSLSVDSLRLDSLARAADTLNFFERKKADYMAKRKERLAQKAIEDAARKVVLDSIGRARQVQINAKLDAEKVREARQIAQRKAKLAQKEAKKLRRDVARGKLAAEDTTALMQALAVDTAALIKELADIDSLTVDSLALDSLALDSLALDSLVADSVKVDSLYRLTKGYRNVKIYRSDFQAVADSMVTTSIDSIIRLYIAPVLWHDANQVTSEVMDIYSSNNKITKAIFTEGNPIMASELPDKKYYNQVAGKVITSLFADGEVYRNNVDGNAQTLYFMQDDETQEVDGLMTMESGSATFYIEEQTVVGITYRGEPNYVLYPLEMIPADQSLSLKGFTWLSDRRPEQEDVFDRTIRPTQREENSALPRPEFPIYEALNANRKHLIESKLWLERDDVVSPQAQEWMESLGYQTGQPRPEQ